MIGINKKRIIVMMSTYNGEKYLEDQIESILLQQDVIVDLWIRDDGSSDSTINILKKYDDYNNCHVIFGENLGAAMSFIDLIFTVPEAEFYSFSDQDDIWDSDKLILGVTEIENNCKPALYHGLAGRVDEYLRSLENKNYIPINTFGSALMTSATGCTMIFNYELMKKLRLYRPKYVSMHDAWVYRIAFSINSYVTYDYRSHMKYRQHSSNVSGGNMTFLDKFKKIVFKNAGLKSCMAQEILLGYKDIIEDDNKQLLIKLAFYKKNIRFKTQLIIGKKLNVSKTKTNIQNKLLLLFNLI